jgi:hypothetical protein
MTELKAKVQADRDLSQGKGLYGRINLEMIGKKVPDYPERVFYSWS